MFNTARVHDIEVDEKEAPIGALLALPIDLTLPYGRGSDWSTPYARILSIGRHLRKALTYVSRTHTAHRVRGNGCRELPWRHEPLHSFHTFVDAGVSVGFGERASAHFD